MIKPRAFIFGSVVHLYWDYQQGRNCASVLNTLKVMNFKKNSHFAIFGIFGKHAKDTKFINGTPHTHTHTHTQKYIHTNTCTHTDRYRYHVYILHFLAHLEYMPKTLIFYLAHHRNTHAQIHRYMHTNRQIQIHKHTCVFVYINKYTHVYTNTQVCMWEI